MHAKFPWERALLFTIQVTRMYLSEVLVPWSSHARVGSGSGFHDEIGVYSNFAAIMKLQLPHVTGREFYDFFSDFMVGLREVGTISYTIDGVDGNNEALWIFHVVDYQKDAKEGLLQSTASSGLPKDMIDLITNFVGWDVLNFDKQAYDFFWKVCVRV